MHRLIFYLPKEGWEIKHKELPQITLAPKASCYYRAEMINSLWKKDLLSD